MGYQAALVAVRDRAAAVPGAKAKRFYANQLGPKPHGQGSRSRARQDQVGRTAACFCTFRAELRRFGAIDFDKGGSGTEAYILHADELYEPVSAGVLQ